jgi:thiamine transporter ThiT
MMGYAGSLTSVSALENKPRLKFTLSALIAGFLRWVCHVLSGVFAFGAYALDAVYEAEGIFSVIAPFENAISNFWAYSTIYNCYVFIDVLLVVVAGILLFSSKAFNNEIGKIKLNTIKNK